MGFFDFLGLGDDTSTSTVPESSNFNAGNGVWSSAIKAGTGIFGILSGQKQQRQVADQASKQADAQMAWEKEQFEAQQGLKKKALLMQAYDNWAQAYGSAATRAMQGGHQMAEDVTGPLTMLARR